MAEGETETAVRASRAKARRYARSGTKRRTAAKRRDKAERRGLAMDCPRAVSGSTGAERRDPNAATDTTRVPNAVTIEAASRADLSRLWRVALERDPKAYMYTPRGRDTRKSTKMQWEHGWLNRDRTFGKHGTSTGTSGQGPVVRGQWSVEQNN